MKDRAWQSRNRQKDHIKWLDHLYDDGYLMNQIASIHKQSITRREALDIELKLIDSIRPRFNRNFELNAVCILTKESFQKAKILRSQGVTYSKIAEELNVSAMTIHRALAGGTKKYYDFN